MASLKDISIASGVSIRTVSRAINGEGYVDAETRSRVLKYAKELGYKPNQMARSLKTKKSYEVTMIIQSMNELHMLKIAGLEQSLREADYALTIVFDRDGEPGSLSALKSVESRMPAAVAVLPSIGRSATATVEYLENAEIPYVVIDAKDKAVDGIRIDRQQGVYEAALYLAGKDRKRIAYLGPPYRNRLDGYIRACSELDREPVFVETSDDSDQFTTGRLAASQFLKLDPRPDGVQCYSDEMALGFIGGLNDKGIKIPREVAVIGFDDRRAASLSWPRLTTVAQPNWSVGVATAEVLLAKINGEPPPPTGWSRSLPTQLLLRESA